MIGVFNINSLNFDMFDKDRELQKIEGRPLFKGPFVSGNEGKHGYDTFDTVILSDQFIPQADKFIAKIKIAHLEEPFCLIPQIYQYTLQNLDKFTLVFTHHKEFVGLDPKIKFYPVGGCFLDRKDIKLYPKTKNCSIIASSKNFLQGHVLRHRVIKELNPNEITIKQGEPFEYKLNYLKDFRYSIVIENCKQDYYFTEKLIDCIKTGTIPIYWGCPSISNFFDINGILQWDTLEDLLVILKNISEEDYLSRKTSLVYNYGEVNKYFYAYEWIWNEIVKCNSIPK
ncbi:MAG: hypothetical protein ACFFKA_01235 [Candidatus Thorarchaeota archaeon]